MCFYRKEYFQWPCQLHDHGSWSQCWPTCRVYEERIPNLWRPTGSSPRTTRMEISNWKYFHCWTFSFCSHAVSLTWNRKKPSGYLNSLFIKGVRVLSPSVKSTGIFYSHLMNIQQKNNAVVCSSIQSHFLPTLELASLLIPKWDKSKSILGLKFGMTLKSMINLLGIWKVTFYLQQH